MGINETSDEALEQLRQKKIKDSMPETPNLEYEEWRAFAKKVELFWANRTDEQSAEFKEGKKNGTFHDSIDFAAFKLGLNDKWLEERKKRAMELRNRAIKTYRKDGF